MSEMQGEVGKQEVRVRVRVRRNKRDPRNESKDEQARVLAASSRVNKKKTPKGVYSKEGGFSHF